MRWKPSSLVAPLLFLAALYPARAADRCPVWPGAPGWMESQLQRREREISLARERSIELISKFLRDFPRAGERAQALFRLAELYWEKAQEEFLARMREFDEQLEDLRAGRRTERPPEPRLDLGQSLKVYEEILEKYPDFEKADTVLYLYGYGLNEQGDEQTALSIYKTLVKKYPQSPFVPDAHLAVGEYEFSKGNYREALASYRKAARHPEHPLRDLAQYKIAWCLFKLGRARQAAEHFRRVLTSARQAKTSRPRAREVDATALEREALEDLAMTFSESGGAKEALAFMRQVGGDEYSIQVLNQLGEVFFRQARYVKAIESFRLLLDKFPGADDAPRIWRRLIEAESGANHEQQALELQENMVTLFGPGSAWAAAHQKDQELLKEANRLCEESLRIAALSRHQKAQKGKSKPLYQQAENAYQSYLKHFPGEARAAEMRFNLAEVQYAQGKFFEAAESYLAASDQLDKPAKRAEAAWAAALAYAKLYPAISAGSQPAKESVELSAGEKGFLQAAHQFREVAPEDPRWLELQFEAGRLLYFRGHFAKASERLMMLAAAFEKPQDAEAAADLALDCHSRLKDWPGLEKSARQLKGNARLKDTALGRRLEEIITGSIYQQGLALNAQSKPEKAVEAFERLAKEFPTSQLAPGALVAAGAALEADGRKEEARQRYLKVMTAYPGQAADAVAALARLFEGRYDYLRAAEAWKDLAGKFPDDRRAPEALLKAAVFFHGLRRHQEEISALKDFSQRWPEHPKAAEAFFAAGVAQQNAGLFAEARRTFQRYLDKHGRRSSLETRRAWLHLGQCQAALRQAAAAEESYKRCSRYSPRKPPPPEELEPAAECLFDLGEMVVEQYKVIELKPPQSRLVGLLKKKAELLKKAESLFARVVATSSLEWASAALFRIGDMYAQFARSIYDAPQPKDLSEQELEVYRDQLQQLAFPVEDKAVQALTISHQMALKHGYHSRWTINTLERLRELDPNRFPAFSEQRPLPALADSFTAAPLILKPMKPEQQGGQQ